MGNDPFTIRIFVPDGDLEGVRLIDRMNWTGLGVVVPREKWLATKHRSEFSRTGVYILSGQTEDNELPTIYVGEPAKPIGPIPYADAPSGSMQGPRYTSFAKLLTAKKVTDLSQGAMTTPA